MSWSQKVKAAFARPWSLLRKHRWLVFAGAICIPPHAFVTLWMPRLWGGIIDGIDAAHRAPGTAAPLDLASTCWLLLGLAAAEALLRYVSRQTLIDVSRHVEQDLKDQALAHLQTLPIAWFDRARTGDITSRLTQDVELVRFVMGPLLLHGGSALCLLPAGIWCMATMNVPVTIAAGAVLGLLFAGLRMLMPRLHKWSKKSQEAIGDLSQRAQEDFAGIRLLWQFAAEPRELAAMATRNRRCLTYNLRLTRLRSLMNAITHSTTGAVSLGVLAVGGYEVIRGTLTVGQLFQFTQYLMLLMFPLEILGWTLATMPRAFAAATRIEEIFAIAPEPGAGATPALRGDLSVRNLTFAYPGANKPSLENLSFDLRSGGKLGITGPVGCGKSTLLALLLRFYDPPRGTILIDGHDVLDLAPAAIRALFALAPQEPFLFSDTLRANVEFGRGPSSDADLSDAVRAAALDQDLPQLQHGLDTRVGERGVTLSGGQKQRASLARALLSERPALLLDDTLSAVDPHTERRILDGLNQTRRGRTMIAATHRLSVIADADLILVLDDGAVRERGTHRELLQQHGLYATAWRRQSEALALEGGTEP